MRGSPFRNRWSLKHAQVRSSFSVADPLRHSTLKLHFNRVWLFFASNGLESQKFNPIECSSSNRSLLLRPALHSITTTPTMPPLSNATPGPEGHKSWIIQKYGGTSVGKFLSTIVTDIVPSYRATNRVAVVCSARSGKTKALGTTNLLLQAASQALEDEEQDVPSLSASMASLPPLGASTPSRPPSARGLEKRLTNLALSSSPSPSRGEDSSPPASIQPSYQLTVDQILSDHLEAARAHVKNPELLASLEQGLSEDCSRLRDFLLAARVRTLSCPLLCLEARVKVLTRFVVDHR